MSATPFLRALEPDATDAWPRDRSDAVLGRHTQTQRAV